MSTPVFYVPGLVPGPGNTTVPPQVVFFPTGIPGTFAKHKNDGLPDKDDMAGRLQNLVREALPLGPDASRAALNDMLRMGEDFAAGGLLKELAAHRLLQETQGKWQGRPGENSDLVLFAETGELPAERSKVKMADWGEASAESKAAAADDIRKEMENCQKVLLLAESLEQRQLELSELEKKYNLLEKSLQETLAEGRQDKLFSSAEDEKCQEEQVNHPETETSPRSLSWRAVVDAVLPFLPVGAVLYTDDSQMALDLRDAGMLQPFPEDKVDICAAWPQEIVTGLLHASLPAWRLVGRRGPATNRPWLERDVEILVARPSSGWTAVAESGPGRAEEMGRKI